jgi:dTDP-4-dehydrorhamnose 3,5-epimerase-like enzyme
MFTKHVDKDVHEDALARIEDYRNNGSSMSIEISELRNAGDARGLSFSLPAAALEVLGNVADLHLASTGPQSVRGNHFHVSKQEIILVLPGAAWSFHWDEGEGLPVQHRNFTGETAVLMQVSPGCSHAVRNEDSTVLWLLTCSSEIYDPSKVVARKVI